MKNDPSSSPRQPDVPGRLKILVVVNTLLLVAVAGGVLWVVTRPLGPDPAGYGLTMDGEALLKDEAARRGLPEGQPAPGFTHGGDSLGLTTLDGGPAAPSDYVGPVWVTFWATYCHACKLEEPDMRRAFDAYRADGLLLVAIDVGEDANVVRRYVEDRDLPWTVLLDESGTAVDAFGAIGTPIHYFIAADGTIVSRAFGRLSYAEMDDHLATLMGVGGAQPTPPAD